MKAYVTGTKEAAAMGGGLLAKYAWWRGKNGHSSPFEEMMEGQVIGLECVAVPNDETAQVYEELVGRYTTCEDFVVKLQGGHKVR